ncbi:NIPSNAP domain containing protein [Pandoraea eparura]|uniref:NIPSNAP domain containing protein n=1 Tax=Pandoraea eparura TaxID=2508291 RepID=A0A5E4RG20_9BURK|nr:NIPSNAP family protein [Pandoraea eparura]VVD61474.1 NIPSNAP domain containing protein [Pandoraea eparura]
MLIEHRTYTLRPGATERFWATQQARGEHALRPLLERLIGAFAARSGASDQITSLYRYDSFDDWHTRLFGVYGNELLQPYFRAVRPLIVQQESQFLVPAPLPELTPLWGNGRDALPGADAPLGRRRKPEVVEQTTLTFTPGGVPACWEAVGRFELHDDAAVMTGLLGAFGSIAGALNQIRIYRCLPDAAAWAAHRTALGGSPRWRSFLEALAPFAIRCDYQWLAPSPVPDMSPLFAPD